MIRHASSKIEALTYFLLQCSSVSPLNFVVYKITQVITGKSETDVPYSACH